MTGYATPKEIRVSSDRRSLTLVMDQGKTITLPAEFLRVLSPSAEVQGHSPEQRVTVAGKRDVAIANILPVGHYAIRIVFDDGHDTGIYSWRFLNDLHWEREARWAAYLADLDAKALSRGP